MNEIWVHIGATNNAARLELKAAHGASTRTGVEERRGTGERERGCPGPQPRAPGPDTGFPPGRARSPREGVTSAPVPPG